MDKRRIFIIFCIIGVINTLVDLTLYLLLRWEGLPILVANVISTSTALTVSYILNKRFTFKAQGTTNRAFVPFVVVTLAGLWLLQPVIIYGVTAIMNTAAVSDALTPLYGNYETLKNLAGKLIATPFTLIWNFLLYKKFVFKTKLPRPDQIV